MSTVLFNNKKLVENAVCADQPSQWPFGPTQQQTLKIEDTNIIIRL
jgi:hypothetical protein